MIEVILDSSYLVALVDEKDRWHQQASNVHEALKARGARAVYFDCVINEALSVLGKRLEQRQQSDAFRDVLAKVQQLVPMGQITWLYTDIKRCYTTLLAVMEAHQGRLNFHDALIVTAAREMKITYIVSFDADYDEVNELRRIEAALDL